MQKTSSTSNYDVLVIRHQNQTYKSTPFQAVFSEKALKARDPKKPKNKDLSLYINDQLVDLPMRVDPNSGRVQFQKKYIRKTTNFSDSSDFSDDERYSTRSNSKQRHISGSNLKSQSLEDLRNEQMPKNFWQFAWLFNSKKEPTPPQRKPSGDQEDTQSRLARIKQEPYEGEQSCKQPLFQLSLCGNLLAKVRKDAGKEELEKMFYANKIQYKDFIKDPLQIINDKQLVVRIDNSLYTWQLGATILACKYAFGMEPGDEFVDAIIKAKTKKNWFQIFNRDSNVTKLDIEEKVPIIQPPTKLEDTQIIRYRKAPDSGMLEKMKLKMGQNKARFTLELASGLLEETQFKVYLWDENEHIVVSDIDGTITKSDVMGQLKTNYIHKGVCLLYNEIYKRNYKFLYMTARAIGQYSQTRRFLEKEVEENGMRLPPGPLLMSPDGYLKSFTREVIEKAPDQLKIKLLASVNEIFPNTKRPIVAGFGNRQTDSIAYLRIKIPEDKIFCINEKSIITNQKDKLLLTCYPDMLQKINEYFPQYIKPQLSQLQNTSDKKQEEPEQQVKVSPHRKLSHSEFYQRSPESKRSSVKEDEHSPKVSRALSEEGDREVDLSTNYKSQEVRKAEKIRQEVEGLAQFQFFMREYAEQRIK